MTERRASGRLTGLVPALAIAVALVSAGCATASRTSASATPEPAAATGGPGREPTGPSTAPATPPPTAGRTVGPPPSQVPFPSSLPGLSGWTVVTPGSVRIAVVGGALQLTLTRRALWFQGERGVLVGQPVRGDFRITAGVRAANGAGLPLATRSDGLVELGGLMARADNAARENYVFVVVGTDANDLSVETKSTTDSNSRFDGPSWPAAAADLRLCRVGATFTALKRPVATSGPWTVAATIRRPDLPDTLLVGPNVYANGDPDLVVTFTNLRIEPVTDPSGCTGR